MFENQYTSNRYQKQRFNRADQIILYPRLEANPEAVNLDLRFLHTSGPNSMELVNSCKIQTGLNRTLETQAIHILPTSKPKGKD
jgi:hypothetical protein